jgi:hypothetical protein
MTSHDCQLLLPIMNELVELHHYMTSFECHNIPPADNSRTYEVFPMLSIKHGRGVYKMDGEKADTKDKLCDKPASKQNTLSPGVFTIFCKHGIYENICMLIILVSDILCMLL